MLAGPGSRVNCAGRQPCAIVLEMTALYVIIDPEGCAGRDPVAVAEQALHGGCSALQLRAKVLSGCVHLELARALRARCDAFGVPFWVNDRPDIALLAGAHGVHVGQEDLPVSALRAAFPQLAIGLSTHTVAQAEAAAAAGVDLVAFGPVFSTRSKEAPDPVVGLAQLAQVCVRLAGPVVAIGGICSGTASRVAQAGAAFAAVISAVCGAEDPRAASSRLCAELRGGDRAS